MTSVRYTSGDYLETSTQPTITGDWIYGLWIKCASGEYGDGVNDHTVFGWGTTGISSEGVGLSVLAFDNTSIRIFVFRSGGGEFDSTTLATGSSTAWVFVSIQHASGSPDYTVRWRPENETMFRSDTITLTTQIISGGVMRLGSDQFDDHAVDSDTRKFFCQATTMSDATLLAASRNLNSAPAGTNLHWLDLDSATNAEVNGGTGGNWTVTGTLQTDASEPTEAAIEIGQHTLYVPPAAGVGTSLTTATALDTSTTGSTFVVFVMWFDATAVFTGTPVDDNKSNTYTQIQSTVVGSGGYSQLNAGAFYCQNGAGGSGHTFTAHWTSGANFAGMFVVEIVGGATSGILDQAPAGLEDTSSPYTSNTTGTTTQAVELILALITTESAGSIETLDWTANGFIQLDQAADATPTVTGATAYKLVSSTGTYQSSVTSSGAGTTGAITFIATFKAAVTGNTFNIIPPTVRESFLD